MFPISKRAMARDQKVVGAARRLGLPGRPGILEASNRCTVPDARRDGLHAGIRGDDPAWWENA